jgi:hypothetical protein
MFLRDVLSRLPEHLTVLMRVSVDNYKIVKFVQFFSVTLYYLVQYSTGSFLTLAFKSLIIRVVLAYYIRYSILPIIRAWFILFGAYPCSIFRNIHNPTECLVYLFAQNNSRTILQIFVKFHIGEFHKKFSVRYNFRSDWTVVVIASHGDLLALS